MNHGLFTVHFSIHRPTFPYGHNLEDMYVISFINVVVVFSPFYIKIIQLKHVKRDMLTISGILDYYWTYFLGQSVIMCSPHSQTLVLLFLIHIRAFK